MLEQQRLEVYSWHFLSVFVLAGRRHAPLWGEAQAHKPLLSPWQVWASCRETALMNQLFASAFLDFQSFLRQMLPEVPHIDLFCGLWGG